jgi:hypothetical protein
MATNRAYSFIGLLSNSILISLIGISSNKMILFIILYVSYISNLLVCAFLLPYCKIRQGPSHLDSLIQILADTSTFIIEKSCSTILKNLYFFRTLIIRKSSHSNIIVKNCNFFLRILH